MYRTKLFEDCALRAAHKCHASPAAVHPAYAWSDDGAANENDEDADAAFKFTALKAALFARNHTAANDAGSIAHLLALCV